MNIHMPLPITGHHINIVHSIRVTPKHIYFEATTCVYIFNVFCYQPIRIMPRFSAFNFSNSRNGIRLADETIFRISFVQILIRYRLSYSTWRNYISLKFIRKFYFIFFLFVSIIRAENVTFSIFHYRHVWRNVKWSSHLLITVVCTADLPIRRPSVTFLSW